jgi:hypothetical protein
MKRSFLLICFGLLLAASNLGAGIQAPPGMLYIYNIHKLPADVQPLYISGDSVLAFGPRLITDLSAGTPLPFSPAEGDYYILRVRDNHIFDFFVDPRNYAVVGDAIIFKALPKNAEFLSGYGWGLTRLMTPEKTETPSPEFSLPAVAVVDSDIVRAISVITPQSSHQLIADLSSISTRYSFTRGCRQAEQYVYDKFDSLGLTTSFFDFQYSGTDMRDVIGQLNGVVHPESVIIVCAHLDCTSEMPEQLAPGAEDNGTGTAVVLEAARALCGQRMDLSVRFVAFSGEEQGLIGSECYAAYVQAQGENISAVLNADMTGYSGLYAEDMHIFSDPNSFSLGAIGAHILANYTSLDTVSHYEPSPRYGSDHYPFAIRGYRSIFFIDAWQGFDWYPYYHTIADTLGNLNMNQQAAAAQAVTAMTATLARMNYVPPFIPGDANGSGDVNGLDVVFLVNYLKGLGPAPVPLLSGDANGDCAANGLDVVYLVNYLKGGPAPLEGDCG